MSSPDKSTDHIEPYSPDLIPVKGKDGWYRDPESNAVVNCNKTEYDDYMAAYNKSCLLYTSPSPRDRTRSRMPSSA